MIFYHIIFVWYNEEIARVFSNRDGFATLQKLAARYVQDIYHFNDNTIVYICKV